MRLSAIVDRLFDSPLTTVLNVRDAFRVTYPTAKSDFSKLEGLGILPPLPSQKTATYFCPPIFEIIYADAYRAIEGAVDGLAGPTEPTSDEPTAPEA